MNTYRILSKKCDDTVKTGSQLPKLGCINGAPQCPAIVVNGDRVIAIGRMLNSAEVKNLEASCPVGVDVAGGEVAIEFGMDVLQKAVEEMMAAKA